MKNRIPINRYTHAFVILLFIYSFMAESARAQQSAQTKSTTQRTVWKFQLPKHQALGPVTILAHFEYHFLRSTNGGNSYADLHIKLIKTELAAVDGTPGFKYRNEMWTGNELSGIDGADDALTGFREIEVIGLSFSVDIIEAGVTKRLEYDDEFANYNHVLQIKPQTDLNHITIMWSSVITKDISFRNSSKLQNRIDACIKLNADRDAYKKLIWAADADFKNKKWADSKAKYLQASKLLYREQYPKDQIAKIDEILAKPQPAGSGNTNSKPNTNTTGGRTNSTTNNNKGNENGMYTRGDLEKSSNDRTGSDDDYWGTGKKPVAANNSNNQNGRQPDIPAGTPPMVKDKEGNYYVQDNTGKYVKTTKANYDAVKQNYNAERNKPAMDAYNAEKKKNEQAALDEFYNGQNTMLDHLKSQQQKSERDGQMASNSFYAAQAKSNAQQGMQDLSHLDGSFESLEELNNAFRQQNAAISDQQQQLTDAGRGDVEATMDFAFRDADETTAAFKPLANTIGTMISDASAEREAREARERLKTERAEHERAIKENRRNALISMRGDLIKKFPEGGVPLSFHKVPGNALYFFAYVLPPGAINADRPTVQVSNVFQVQRYSDGTWPFKNSILSDLKKGSGAMSGIVMIGYYTDKSQATQMHDAFVDIAGKCEMNVKPFAYKGKISSGGGSGNNADFWGGSEAPNAPATKNVNVGTKPIPTKNNGDDYWGTEAPKQTTKNIKPDIKPPAVKSKSSDDDYWNGGNNKKQEQKPANKSKANDDYWK